MPAALDSEPPASLQLLLEGGRYGDMEDIEAAIADGVDVNGKDSSGRTSLHMASANGHAEVVVRLLGAGANVNVTNAENNTPLHWACLNGHVEVVKALMEAGASPTALNSGNNTPVDEALGRGFQACVDAINASEVVAQLEQAAMANEGGGEGDAEGEPGPDEGAE